MLPLREPQTASPTLPACGRTAAVVAAPVADAVPERVAGLRVHLPLEDRLPQEQQLHLPLEDPLPRERRPVAPRVEERRQRRLLPVRPRLHLPTPGRDFPTGCCRINPGPKN